VVDWLSEVRVTHVTYTATAATYFIMVSPLNTDIVANPTRSLLELYDPGSPLDEFPKAVSRHFSDIFKAQHAFDEVRMRDQRRAYQTHELSGRFQFLMCATRQNVTPIEL
jgi:hypothetical protein